MKYKNRLLFALLLTGSLFLNSQSNESELRHALTVNKDSSLINSYLELAKYYYISTGKGDSLIHYSKKALELSKNINSTHKELEILKYIGTGYLANSQYEKSKIFFEKGLQKSKELNHEKYIGEFYNKLGALFQNKEENDKAIENLLKSIPYLIKNKNHKSTAEVYYGISLIFAQQGQRDRQLEHLENSLNVIANHKINSPFLENVIYSYASQTYLDLYLKKDESNYEKQILTYSKNAIQIADKNGFKSRKATSHIVLASYYKHKRDYRSATKYAKEVLKSKSLIAESSILNAYIILIENNINNNDKNQTFKYLDSLNSLKLKEEAYYASSIFKANYSAYKHFKKDNLALTALEKKVEVDKILNDTLKVRSINKLEAKYQSKLKDVEIENLKNIKKINELEIENKKSKIKKLTILLVFAALVILLSLFIFKIMELKKMRNKNVALRLAYERQLTLEKELSDVRDEIAQDFHDDLGNKLARISLLSNLVSGESSINDPKVKSKIKQITEDANGLYRGTRDFVFSLKSNSDYIEEIATYLTDFGEDFFKKTKIKFTVIKNIEINDRLPHYWNKHLIFIFKEALTNTLKHSKCKEVKLSFNYKKSELKISCQDDGIGINEAVLTSQNGLANMKKRAEKINSNLLIESKKNQFTKILFIGKTK